jgi:glycerol uptake facilitator protein
MREQTLEEACLAEAMGTFLLVFFGAGSVHVAVLFGGFQGLLQVALVWALGVTLAIYSTGAVSGAHLNPAVTIAVAAFRQFPVRRVGPYILSQMAGAILGGIVLYALFGPLIAHFEAGREIVRGAPGSELSAMLYGEYFPNPAMVGTGAAERALVGEVRAMLAEGLGTGLLVFFIFSLTEPRNGARPTGGMAAPLIGLTVAAVICIIAPLTQAGLNPARDLGPRLVAWWSGWGAVAIPGPQGGFISVYVLSPIVGGLIGAAAYTKLLRRALPAEEGA